MTGVIFAKVAVWVDCAKSKHRQIIFGYKQTSCTGKGNFVVIKKKMKGICRVLKPGQNHYHDSAE